MSATNGPKERLLETACRLFYYQGYNSTGINQLLEEANVAKASLYQHFGSKEDVGIAYLKAARVEWFEGLDKWTGKQQYPFQKLIACFDFLEHALRNDNFLGCKFINMQAELADNSPLMQQQIREHKTKLRNYIKQFVREALPNDPVKANLLGDTIYILFEGTIVECKIYKDVWPIKIAKKTIKSLMET